MLHNMACHELALASTLFGVSVERVASVQLEPELCEIVYLDNGGADWSRVAFTLELHPSDSAPVHASVGANPGRSPKSGPSPSPKFGPNPSPNPSPNPDPHPNPNPNPTHNPTTEQVGVPPTSLRFVVDRCGGNFSRAHLKAPWP